MTESQYWAFIRSGLRQKWMRWRPRFDKMREGRRAATAEDQAKYGNRIKYTYHCELCNNYFPEKEMQVDHIVPCGACSDAESVGRFAIRLFVETSGLQRVCKPCHKAKTAEDRLVIQQEKANRASD